MKYAFYPGCVSRGACPELFASTLEVCAKLGIELDFEPMRGASCTGSGILQEKNLRLGDMLNARTFAMAENSGLPLLTICSTCQGVMSQANERLKADDKYLSDINVDLSEEKLEYKGSADPRHLLWVIIEDIGLDKKVKVKTKEQLPYIIIKVIKNGVLIILEETQVQVGMIKYLKKIEELFIHYQLNKNEI